ncbi:hypothetical protein J6590_004555 [Homalodisca vitripennis]|nr:hypothetical protein J6590_004555 [Homalodisca vitripennis]
MVARQWWQESGTGFEDWDDPSFGDNQSAASLEVACCFVSSAPYEALLLIWLNKRGFLINLTTRWQDLFMRYGGNNSPGDLSEAYRLAVPTAEVTGASRCGGGNALYLANNTIKTRELTKSLALISGAHRLKPPPRPRRGRVKLICLVDFMLLFLPALTLFTQNFKGPRKEMYQMNVEQNEYVDVKQ